MDQLIKKRSLHRISSESLSFIRREADAFVVFVPGRFKEVKHSETEQDATIGLYVKKFCHLSHLFFENIWITEKLCWHLHKNKRWNRGLGRIVFNDCIFDVSEKGFAQAISGLTTTLVAKNCLFKQPSFGNMAFEDVRLNELEICGQNTKEMAPINLQTLTDAALDNILEPSPVRINLEECSTAFTWNAVEKAITKYYKPENIVEWDFGIIERNGVTNEQIKSALSRFGMVINYTTSDNTNFMMRGKYNSENTICVTINK